MRVLVQILSVLTIAFGMGLLIAGRSALPPLPQMPTGNVGMESMPLEAWKSVVDAWGDGSRGYRDIAIALNGFGAGFLTLGLLGLIVPWVNTLIDGWRGRAVATGVPSVPDHDRSQG